MCVIAIRTIGATISDETIRKMYAANSNGAGIMWAQDGKVHWRKGFFKVEHLLDAWHRVPDGVTAAVHCRITTHGGTCDRLCHPFPLTNKPKELYKLKGKADAVLMHNGIMSFMEKDGHFDKKLDSDSSAYAKKLFDRYKEARIPKSAEEMEAIRRETSGNRILILNGDGTFFTAGEWTWEDGVLYSNTHFKWHYSYNDDEIYGGGYYARTPGVTAYRSKGTGWEGYTKKYDNVGNPRHYSWEDDDDDYLLERGVGNARSLSKSTAVKKEDTPSKWQEIADSWKRLYGIDDKKESEKAVEYEDEPVVLSQEELEDYAADCDMTPIEYVGEAKFSSTGESITGPLIDCLYVDDAMNVYELDEDTLVFNPRDDIYCEMWAINREDDEYMPLLQSGAGY